MANPKVSVCIPTYNSSNFLAQAIESVLSQSFEDYELIISDNASTDETMAIAKYFEAKDSRIRLYTNSINLGMVANFNNCLEYSRGSYIKFLCSDDIFFDKNTLLKFVNILDKDIDVVLVASARNIIDGNGNISETWTIFDRDLISDGTMLIKDCLLRRQNRVGEPTAVIFRNDGNLAFDDDLGQLMDLDFWLEILKSGKFAYLSEPLVGFRKHLGQQSEINERGRHHLDDFLHILKKHVDNSCLGFSAYEKLNIKYQHFYLIHRLYKLGVVDRAFFLKYLKDRYSVVGFYFYFPIFKKIRHRLRRIVKYDFTPL